MRFEELAIEKFGIYDHRILSLAGMPGLVIIYGPNEAGKSTCLAAITDFLFGIPHNSPHGQIFGYNRMRLRASLRLAGGGRLALCRRKGRSARTLSDLHNKAVDETVLSKWLGSTSRAGFETLFGLDHKSLRRGGEQLLDAEGDIGRLIVEAGGGLRSLVQSLDKLKEDELKLFSTRRAADRAFYRALDSFEAAEREIKQGLLTREAYDQAQKLHKLSQDKIVQLRAERRKVNERLQRRQRLVRVIPHLNTLAIIEESLTDFADLENLKDDFGSRAGAAPESLRSARAAFAQAEEKRADLEKKIHGLAVSPAIAEAEALIRDINEKSTIISKERSDRPNRQAELTKLKLELAPIKQLLGIETDADLEAKMPSKPMLDRVGELAVRGLDLRPRIESLKSQIDGNAETLRNLQNRRREREAKGFDKPFGVSAADFAQLPGLARTMEGKRKQADRKEQEIAGRLDAIRVPSVEDLEILPCPDAAVIQAEIDRSTALEQVRIKQVESIATHTSTLEAAKAEIERLNEAGEVPTDAVIAAARRSRRDAWLPIREAYLADETSGKPGASIAQRTGTANRFEEQVEKADLLADRKSTEAKRIADLELAEKRRDEAAASIATLSKALEETEKAITKARQAWADAWPEASGMEPDLSRLKGFFEERKTILGMVESFHGLRGEIEQLDADFAPRLDMLRLAEKELGLCPVPDASLNSRIQAASQAVTAHQDEYNDFRSDHKAIMKTKEELDRLERSLEKLTAAEAAWREQWKQAVRGIGLSEDSLPERANEFVAQWAAAGGIMNSIRLTRTRLRRMDEDERELGRLIGEASGEIDFELPKDFVAAARMLKQKWDSNHKLQIERSGLESRLEELTAEWDRKKAALDTAHEAVEAVCAESKCEECQLEGIAERHRRYVEAKERRLHLLETIAGAGDGIPLDALREQWGGRDIVEIKSEIAQIEEEEKKLGQAIEEEAGNLRDREREVDRYETEEGIGRAVAERERAGAELRQVIEDYLEITMARDLLARAIDRIRHEQQDPLITRAGALFSMTTSEAFAGIETDVDDKGQPVVVGRRPSGETVSIGAMSDGTRDQLFLAFRLAAIEQYCATAEPLPFIADDLLVHFDDKRGRETLKLLAEIGKRMQVLLFTHHRSILDAARELIEAGSAGVCRLG